MSTARPNVTLTLPEVVALKRAVLGDAFDARAMERAVAKIERAEDRAFHSEAGK